LPGFHRLDGLENVPVALKGAMVAIGSFDGVHRGHQAVLERLKAQARARNVPAVMLTFEPHPRDVFAPAPFMFRLTPPDIKARIAAALGLDGIVLMPFSRDLSMVEAEDFVSRFLVKALRVSGVVVGADFHFGHNRRGTPDFLRAAGAIHGFAVDILDLLPEGAEAVSSSRIREALKQGEVRLANGLLGYHWFFGGEVVKGDQRGRTLGFPTANLVPDPRLVVPDHGIYACRAEVDGEAHIAAVNVGVRPTFKTGRGLLVEAFLLDFEGDIYGRELRLDFLERLRGERRFDSVDALIEQMGQDVVETRRVAA